MTWIKTVPFTDADEALRRAQQMQQELYPIEYSTPVHPVADGQTSSIVASHSLIPDALYHAFATFGVLMSPDLPLSRREHEMITHRVKRGFGSAVANGTIDCSMHLGRLLKIARAPHGLAGHFKENRRHHVH